MDVGKDSSLNMDKEFAISAWIKANSYSGKIISKGTNYKILINPETQKINFVYGSDEYIESYNPINLNEWQQIAISIDWEGVWKIYINGNQEFIGSKIVIPSLNYEDTLIGQEFNGEIEDIMLFNRSLSSENIKFLYNNQRQTQ
jgi:hypothetical protein